jgi:uncharacterized protein YqjF (DUF2071 family)
MKSIHKILSAIDHRPWGLPSTKWAYYQEWNRALFLHWKVPAQQLRQLVPPQLDLDVYNGETLVSLVAFTMEQTRPKRLPAIGFISNFDEVNLRTYVRIGNKQGVYFLSIEAGKWLSAFTARKLSGLPYESASILRRKDAGHRYTSSNKKRGSRLDAFFMVGNQVNKKSDLDIFLTEKYCVYTEKANKVFCYDVHHKPWDLYQVEKIDLEVNYRIGEIALLGKPDLVHFSDGVKVIAWDKVAVES